MNTIKELEKWMSENNIRDTYTPNARYVTDEGVGLEEVSGFYIWYFVERGERENLEYFKSEKEAAEFVKDYILKNNK